MLLSSPILQCICSGFTRTRIHSISPFLSVKGLQKVNNNLRFSEQLLIKHCYALIGFHPTSCSLQLGDASLCLSDVVIAHASIMSSAANTATYNGSDLSSNCPPDRTAASSRRCLALAFFWISPGKRRAYLRIIFSRHDFPRPDGPSPVPALLQSTERIVRIGAGPIQPGAAAGIGFSGQLSRWRSHKIYFNFY